MNIRSKEYLTFLSDNIYICISFSLSLYTYISLNVYTAQHIPVIRGPTNQDKRTWWLLWGVTLAALHLLLSPGLIIAVQRRSEDSRRVCYHVLCLALEMVDEGRAREWASRKFTPERDDWRGFSTNYRPTSADCGNRGLRMDVDSRPNVGHWLGKAAFLSWWRVRGSTMT